MRFCTNRCNFRLKQDNRNLPSKEYVENLCQYLGDARSKTVLTADDLSELLEKLNQENPTENPEADQNNPIQTECSVYLPDEHVGAVWIDEKENILLWFLGVIDSILADTINIRYYNHRDKKGQCWTFPEDDCILLETIKYLEALLFPICKPV